MADQYSQNVREIFTFHMQIRYAASTLVNSLWIFSEYVANMIQDSKLNKQQISCKHSANMRWTCI